MSELGPPPDCSRFIDAPQSDCCFYCHEDGNVFYFEISIAGFRGQALLCQDMASDMRLILLTRAIQGMRGDDGVLLVLHQQREALIFPDEPEFDP